MKKGNGDLTLTTYNKLVRDKMPEYIENTDNRVATFNKLKGRDLILALADKIVEEAKEVKEALINNHPDEHLVEELADVITVIYGITFHKEGITYGDIETARANKLRERGGFYDGILLKEAYDAT